MAGNKVSRVDEITSIASKRGIFFPTAEIYGGKAGFFTYGHIGKLLKNRWESLWRNYFLSLGDNFYEIQSNSILPEEVFIASGHIEHFNDPMSECRKCHSRYRLDQLLEDKKIEAGGLSLEEMNKKLGELKAKCLKCGGELGEGRMFNMMFAVPIGFAGEKGYLSPETAQGAYISFKNMFQATRGKLPVGLAIIDKAYRNEISPRQLFFRLREFSQAELQIFFDSSRLDEMDEIIWDEVKDYGLLIKKSSGGEIEEIKGEDMNKKMKIGKFYIYYLAKVQKFYLDLLGIPKEKFRLRELGESERAFYNKVHFDVEIFLETLGGFKEVGGVHYRGDHDLSGHQKISKEKLEVSVDGKRILPHVLELSFGVDRNIWTLLDIFYDKDTAKSAKGGEEERDIFRFPALLSPFHVAVLPLVNKDGMDNLARDIARNLRRDFAVFYDDSGSIGRRYRRMDEIGVKFCITIDSGTLKDKDVTIRDRDSLKQIRVKIEGLPRMLDKLIKGEEFIK